MAFKYLKRFETVAEETSRLSQSPEGSINHKLSKMPVKYDGLISKGMVVSLPTYESNGNKSSIIIVIRDIIDRSTQRDNVYLNNSLHSAIIVSSNHPSYPVGGNDISVSASEIRRGTVLNVAELTNIAYAVNSG